MKWNQFKMNSYGYVAISSPHEVNSPVNDQLPTCKFNRSVENYTIPRGRCKRTSWRIELTGEGTQFAKTERIVRDMNWLRYISLSMWDENNE